MNPATGASSLNAVYRLIKSLMPRDRLRIYEAGGGSASFMTPEILSAAKVTVVDIDQDQLAKNAYAQEKILGDIQSLRFQNDTFDLIVCYNVIEHLGAPDQALKLFFDALAPGGLVFIGAPNPSSFSGWVTRVTPHWFHVAYYKYVMGHPRAGTPGNVPFPTVYHPIVEPTKLVNFCERLGFEIVYFQRYEGDLYRQLSEQKPALGKMLSLFVGGVSKLSGRDLRAGDYHLLLQKRASCRVD